MEGQVTKAISNGYGTIAILLNRAQRPLRRQFVMRHQQSTIWNVLINKTLGGDGQDVLGRQCASRFRRLRSSRSAKSLAELARRYSHGRAVPLLKHEAESSQMHSYSLRHMLCSWSGIFYLYRQDLSYRFHSCIYSI